MEQYPGYKIEHCRPNCSKAARKWNSLQNNLYQALAELDLPEVLSAKFKNLLYHHIPKICLAGCPNGCSQPQIKDFGILGYLTPQITQEPCQECQACVHACLEGAVSRGPDGIRINTARCVSCGDCVRVCSSGTLTAGETGWELRLGGRVGRHPRFAVAAGKVGSDSEVVDWVVEILRSYIKHGLPEERLSNFLERLTLNC